MTYFQEFIPNTYTRSDFDFELPPDLIAQYPLPERTASRLLHVTPGRDEPGLADLTFKALPDLVAPGDLMVFNDTRVIKARVLGRKAGSGGRVELLIERLMGHDRALVQMRASHVPGAGGIVELPGGVRAVVLGRQDRFFEVRFEGTADLVGWSIVDWLSEYGQMPLPPYIRRLADGSDEARYQTVYAQTPGAVAAPTAGLHFDEALLSALDAKGVSRATVTLHVGAGTFQPVQHEDLSQHVMHREVYDIPEATAAAIAATRARGGRVLAVGTTSLRALESAATEAAALKTGRNETALFITPGYRFKVVDRLLTNFHLPGSTLLMLVAALGGYATMRTAYAHAIAAQYRFFSYGDAMLLERS